MGTQNVTWLENSTTAICKRIRVEDAVNNIYDWLDKEDGVLLTESESEEDISEDGGVEEDDVEMKMNFLMLKIMLVKIFQVKK